MGVWIEMRISSYNCISDLVTPFVGVWIEMYVDFARNTVELTVTPFVGVWIEISSMHLLYQQRSWSLPSWECGLKYLMEHITELRHLHVTPFVGVWIEIYHSGYFFLASAVTPFVGVWIEIMIQPMQKSESGLSLPSWECGLKYHH